MNRAVKQCLLAFNEAPQNLPMRRLFTAWTRTLNWTLVLHRIYVVLADPDTQRALNFTEFLYLEHSKDNIPGIRTSGNLYGLLPSMSIMEFT